MTSPHVFVRPATSLDAEAIGDIQARTMRAALVAALGKRLPAQVDGTLQAGAFAEAWGEAIANPPSATHIVFSAVSDGQVVGFAAISPTVAEALTPASSTNTTHASDGSDRADRAAEPGLATPTGERAELKTRGVVVEVTALEVPPAYQRAGHGSRLLAAAATTAIEQGASELQIWVLAGDDAHTSFLTAAGFAPAGIRRDLQVGEDLVSQHCWHAFLNTQE